MSQDNAEQYEYCPRCDANLTLQKGYVNSLPYWICKGCGEMLINPEVDAEDDIAWICDQCGAMLNVQDGFADNEGKWACTECGFVNEIDEKNLYDTKEAYIADLMNPYKGLTDDEVLHLTSYRELGRIGDSGDVLVVEDADTGTRYIKKYLTIYDKSIYEYLRDNPVEHMPRILYLAEGSNCLIVLEEFIEGRTLAELIAAEELDEKATLDIARKTCAILKTIHNLPRQIVHRDIKPSNIIVTDAREVYLLDMNAAKWYKPDANDDTNYLGTRLFAAPEQAGYGLKASSTKSDIYALGVLLNVMLTGDVPKQKQAPQPWWQVIEKCISLEADARYSAEELLDVLEKIGEEAHE